MSKSNLRLLSLDGGGVRGLSSLFILKQLMERIDPETPPKPCDYFDMIGGTSTGGLIAIMLGRLEMSVDECIDAYCDLSGKVFGKSGSPLTAKLKIRGRFDARALEDAVKKIVRSRGKDENALLKNDSQDKCKVFVCATSKTTLGTFHLTSYRTDRGTPLLDTAKIWEAARATSAASSFFDPIKIGSPPFEFVDGATGANNPVNQLVQQASDLWRIDALENIHCLVSIGTGRPAIKLFGDTLFTIFSTLKQISTETEETAEAFSKAHSRLSDKGQYFRFNVENGLEDVRLNERKKLPEIREVTFKYTQSENTYQLLGSCARQLKTNVAAHGTPSVYAVPLARVHTYTRRAGLSQQLEDKLQIRHEGSRTPYAVALCGLGGTGKSQLALDYVEKHRNRFRSVLWIDATNQETARASFQMCALELGLEWSRSDDERKGKQASITEDPAVNVVRKFFRSKTTPEDRWLAVIDNADDFRWGLQKIVPEGIQGSIIITSQDNLSTRLVLGGCERLDVSILSEIEAVSLLSQHLKPEMQSTRDTFRRPCEDLVRRLGGLALAVDLAGAYISQSTVSEEAILQYLADYDRHQDELLQLNWFQGLLPTEKTVWTVWDATLSRISQEYENTPIRPDLWLTFLAHFRGKIIQDEIFRLMSLGIQWAEEKLMKKTGEQVVEAFDTILRDLRQTPQGAWDSFGYRQACNVLFRYNLLQPVEGKWPGVTMHSLVKWRAAQHSQHQPWKEWYHILIAAAYYRVQYKNDRIEFRRELILHVPSSAECCTRQDKYSDHAAIMWELFSGINHCEGIYDEAESFLRCALELLKGKRGPSSVLFLHVMINLVQVFIRQEKLDEAGNFLEQVIKIGPERNGADHVYAEHCLRLLSHVYMRQGRPAEAEMILTVLVEPYGKEQGLKYERILEDKSALALVYGQQGKLHEAEQLATLVLEDYKKNLGSDHPGALKCMGALALIRKEQGRDADALALLNDCAQARRRIFGEKHPQTVTTLRLAKEWGKQASTGTETSTSPSLERREQ